MSQIEKALISVNEYERALNIVNGYRTQTTGVFEYATLISICDTRHSYDYLEVGKKYKIRKWYPAVYCNWAEGRRSRITKKEYFSIHVGGMTRKYLPDSDLLLWKFDSK